jgi:hypothetical protein
VRVGGTTRRGANFFAKNLIFAQADLPIYLGPTNITKWNLKKWTEETQKLMAPLEWGRNIGVLKDPNPIAKKSYEALWTGNSGGNTGSTTRKSVSEWRWVAARADIAPW